MLQITINGSDISSHVVSFTREKDLCSSEGIVEFTLDGYATINPYAVIRVYENTILKGTFYTDFTEKMSDGTMAVHGRDNSKRAQDYYIAERFFTEGDTTSRYWIEFFLGLAGIPYNFTTTDTGYIIQEGEMMGLTSCAEVIEMLIRYSGWYIYYDASNTAQIGKLDYDSSSYQATFDDNDIITIVHLKSDQYLRNRAVVWGAGYTGSQEWVFADITVNTPWNYDSLDVRAILARAGFPVPFSQAIATANVLLNEYARLVEEKTITVHGYHDLEIGDFVLIKSQYYNGICLVSAINTSAEDGGGYTTTLILDRRCPRFVGFYDVGGTVYAGTEEDGIWTKPLKTTHTWTDYSAGLSDLNIHDLDVSYGVMSTVTATGYLYGRTIGDTAWIRLQPYSYYDTIGSGYYPAASGVYVASTVSDLDQAIYGVFTISGSDPRTWITRYPAVGGTPTNIFVTLSGETKYLGVDIEANYEDLYVSVVESQPVALNAPYFHTPEGAFFDVMSPLQLDTVDTGDNVMYTGTKQHGITGNYMYVYRYVNPNYFLKRINYRLGSYDQVKVDSTTGVTGSYLQYFPEDEDFGYYFTFNDTSTFIKAYKIDWEAKTVTLASTYTYDSPYTELMDIIGAVNDNDSIRVVFGLWGIVGNDRKMGCVTFDFDTETFVKLDLFTTGTYSFGANWSYYMSPVDVVDNGDGELVFVAHGGYDNVVTTYFPTNLVFLNTRTNTTTKVAFPESYPTDYYSTDTLYGFLAPDFGTSTMYYLTEHYHDAAFYYEIVRITKEGSFTVIKELVDLSDEDHNVMMSYNTSQIIATTNNGIETIHTDAKTGVELFRKYQLSYNTWSQNLGPLNELYSFCGYRGANNIELARTTVEPDRYWEVYTDVEGGEGSNGIVEVYAGTWNTRTGLIFHADYNPSDDDFEFIENIYDADIPATSTTPVSISGYINECGLYRFYSTDYYTINYWVDPDVFSTGFNIVNYLGSNFAPLPNGMGKTGITLNGMYESELAYPTIGTTYYKSAYPSEDGHHLVVDLFSPAGRDYKVHHGDRLDWCGDNEGDLHVTVEKHLHVNRMTEATIKMKIYDTLTYNPADGLIRVRVYSNNGDALFLRINDTEYTGFTYNSSTTIWEKTVTNSEFTDTVIENFEIGFKISCMGSIQTARQNNYLVITSLSRIYECTPYNEKCVMKTDLFGEQSIFKNNYSRYDTWVDVIAGFVRAIGKILYYPEGRSYYNTPYYYGYTSNFMMHTADNNASANVGRILRYRNGEFENVFGLLNAHFNLDISNPSVITAYTGVSTSGTIFISGEEHTTGSSRGDIYFSFAGDYGHFRHINLPTMSGSYIYDTRGFTIVDISGEFRQCIGMVVLSGLYGSVGQFSYIDVTEYEDIGGVITFPDIYTVESFNYVPVALETSNYNHYNTPYFFVGLEGTSTPFLQRDMDTEDFINRSDNFPASRITTIRLDDML